MFLETLNLLNFKNYTNTEASFCPHINCLTGLNGSGKTNVLDAIYYLSITKSAFNNIDSQNIRQGESFFVVNGQVANGERQHKIHCSLKKGDKKSFKVDGAEYEKLSHHLGRFPVVLIAPNDDDLIRDSSEIRRKYFDSILSQTSKQYLEELIKYNHFLKQRNSLLKKFNEKGIRDLDQLEPYTLQLLELGKSLANFRRAFIERFAPDFTNHYNYVSDEKESVAITYNSSALENTFEHDFRQRIEKDIVLQRTTLGIHRDDYQFTIEGNPLKKYGSQGQQKSYLISLKLAQFDYLKTTTQRTPFLLLDDIFDKLDDNRIQMLIKMMESDRFGQIFVTDARPERTRNLLSHLSKEVKIFQIDSNEITL